jgi:ribonuclease G
MSNELIINSAQDECRIALLRDKNLVEFHVDREEDKFTVGDVYLGTVKKIVPGLNAAFIDVGYEKDAFLHYQDLGPQFKTLVNFSKYIQGNKDANPTLGKFKFEPDIDKLGKIAQVLTKGMKIPVQIVKEPISTKGPRLSCELSVAGRYMVLVPFSNAVNISKRITEPNERKRLGRLISSIKPEGFGVIIRTNAEKKEVALLDKDLRQLLDIWHKGVEKLRTAQNRDKIIGEIGRTSSLIRDVLNESFDSVTVDDPKMAEEIKAFLKKIAPEKEKIVKIYSGKVKIFEQLGVERQLKTLFGKNVTMPGGGYLIIEHTEALHVIDVNSGNKSNKEEDQEQNALNTNMQAAKEVARQLRLRDMGGIIVVDFIDMKKADNKKKLFDFMKDEMESDRSKYTVLPLTKFGLMQITRQRVRPEMNITTREKCPTCLGTGTVSATLGISDQAEQVLEHLLVKQNEKSVSLLVHPYLYSYFTKGFPSRRMRWFMKFNRWVRIVQDSSLALNDFKFINKFGEEIELQLDAVVE